MNRIPMKKQLALTTLAMLSISTALTYAAAPVLNLPNALRGADLNFGYTETQNVTVKGFQTSGDVKTFNVTSPLLKDASDVQVEEYSILLAKKPIASYKTGSDPLVNTEFNEMRHTLSAEDKALNEVTIALKTDILDTNIDYYGVVVPQDDNVQEGNHSKEFCFNIGQEKFAEGLECASFGKAAANTEIADTNKDGTSEEEHAAAGADMRLANISHTINKNNVVTLTWTSLSQSANVEIQLYNKEKDEHIRLAIVPMSQEKYEYQAKEWEDQFVFTFIPRDERGKEKRYTINARTETEVKPEIKQVPKVGPVEDMMLIVAITVLAYAGYRLLAPNKIE